MMNTEFGFILRCHLYRFYTCYSKANLLSSLDHNYVWVATCLFHWQLASNMISWNLSSSFIILDQSYNGLCIVHNCPILDIYQMINQSIRVELERTLEVFSLLNLHNFEFTLKNSIFLNLHRKGIINVFCLFLSLFQFNLAYVDTLLSMKKQSPNCLRKSKKDTSNLTLHFGMISLNQVFLSLGKSLLELSFIYEFLHR